MKELYQGSLRRWRYEFIECKYFLPDDRASLSQCTETLAGWCEGLLYGIGLSVTDYYSFTEGAEFLRDVQELSKVSTLVEKNDDGEGAWQIIVEHLCAGFGCCS